MGKVKANNAIPLSEVKAGQSTLVKDLSRNYERQLDCFFKGRDYQLGLRRAEISNIDPTLISVFALKLSFVYGNRDSGAEHSNSFSLFC